MGGRLPRAYRRLADCQPWGSVSGALSAGVRGMPGGTTLTRLIRDRFASEAGG